MTSKLDEAVKAFAAKFVAAVEGLTEAQLADAIKQAIACGDFQRLLRAGDNAQAVVYIPFAREQELLARIRELERPAPVICPGCKNEIDPTQCHCGTEVAPGVVHDNHYPVPMGCTCGYATS